MGAIPIYDDWWQSDYFYFHASQRNAANRKTTSGSDDVSNISP